MTEDEQQLWDQVILHRINEGPEIAAASADEVIKRRRAFDKEQDSQ